jgi:tetratricopeptide (TPR) repeat protein
MSRISSLPFFSAKFGCAVTLLALSPIALFAAINQALPAQTAIVPSPSTPVPQRKAFEHPAGEVEADILMARGEYSAAIAAYQTANLNSAIVWNKIGMAYHHLFALEAAANAYTKALAINPRYAPAANNLAAVYYAQRDFRQAEHFYKRALKYTSEDAVIYCNLGTAYFAEKKYNKGKKEYRKAFSLDQQVFSPSQAALVEAASSREQRVALNYYLAQTYAAAGQQEQALNYLRKAMNEGFKDRKRLIEDKEFAVLRSTPQFRDLLQQENLN